MKTLVAAVAVAFATMAGPSLAEGNLAAERDLTLEINTIDLKFSQEVWSSRPASTTGSTSPPTAARKSPWWRRSCGAIRGSTRS